MTGDPRMVGGRYKLGDLLGRGGMAEVRRAMDTRLGRQVAVKQLRTDLATDPTFQARFRREAQSAAGLNHPSIVSVYDTGEEVDPRTGVSIPYIVMELVEGPTLRDLLREGRKILPERALELMQGVLDALGYSHKAGIIHRDIKPANVMLTPNGEVKVMDFGIARAVADTSATMTQTAAVIGTAQYLSPEQARGETVDTRSDIYSAGCLMYELLVGRPPFVGDSPVSVAYQHVREAPVPPSQLDPMISPDIDAITLKALAKNPADRYQTARDMKADIARVLSGQQATAMVPRVVAAPPPVHHPEAATLATTYQPVDDDEEERPRSRAGLTVLIVSLIVLLLGAAGFGAYRLFRPQEPTAAQTVEVPSVLTYTQQQASDRLLALGLKVATKERNGDSDTEGTIIAQDPVGGSQAEVGSTVTITVNIGPETGTIPGGLVGDQLDDVRSALDKAGFSNLNPQPANSEPENARPNQVLDVSPAEGETVPLETRVTIRYATGKSPVPPLTGRLLEIAQREARDAGFTKFEVKEQESDEVAGIVIEQRPKAGTLVSRNETILLTVAVAPEDEEPDDEEPSPSPEPPSPSATPSR
jgi:eukaryotic-like serine/threonine-protein kinase